MYNDLDALIVLRLKFETHATYSIPAIIEKVQALSNKWKHLSYR